MTFVLYDTSWYTLDGAHALIESLQQRNAYARYKVVVRTWSGDGAKYGRVWVERHAAPEVRA